MRSPARADRVRAFAPGRVNVLGEHTDYNGGLALPFAIELGVTVTASRFGAGRELLVTALDHYREQDSFAIDDPGPPGSVPGWRAFVRGAVAELTKAEIRVPAASLEIRGTVPQGAGLASSAALSVALVLALAGLAGAPVATQASLARLCSRIENDWVGARTGLLDQLASLGGVQDAALLIDFGTLVIRTVPIQPAGWRFAVMHSGTRRTLAGSGYNDRAGECAHAQELLGLSSLRLASLTAIQSLPEPFRSRALHVAGENVRVARAATALQDGHIEALPGLLDASHASLRDLFDISTPEVEGTRDRLLAAGAAGARLMGGGFGGAVLGLLPPDTPVPDGATVLHPARGAYVETI